MYKYIYQQRIVVSYNNEVAELPQGAIDYPEQIKKKKKQNILTIRCRILEPN